MHHKAVLVCSRQEKSTLELKKLAKYLFPSVKEDSNLVL